MTLVGIPRLSHLPLYSFSQSFPFNPHQIPASSHTSPCQRLITCGGTRAGLPACTLLTQAEIAWRATSLTIQMIDLSSPDLLPVLPDFTSTSLLISDRWCIWCVLGVRYSWSPRSLPKITGSRCTWHALIDLIVDADPSPWIRHYNCS